MSTSLQRQLSSLADPSSSLLVPDRRRASIIFTPTEALKYDRETFYQIGLEGLKELESLNPRLFTKYFNSMLFDESSKNFERVVANHAMNKELDEAIEEFLIALSPYMMIKAPLKCMEWLVHRFHIEQFNVEAVLACILPYYDTRPFALVIKILEVEKMKSGKHWLWLVPSVKTGLPVTKSVLFSNGNSVFIPWLFNVLHNFMTVHEEHPENLGTFLAFLTSTVLGILHRFNETYASSSYKAPRIKVVVSLISSRVLELLQLIKRNWTLRQNENLLSAVYMIITTLMIIRKEAPDIAGVFLGTPVMVLLLETSTAAMQKNAILLVNLIASVNYWDGLYIEDEAVRDRTIEAIADISNEMDVYFAARVILKTFFMRSKKIDSKIWDYLASIQMSVHQRADLLRDMFFSHRLLTQQNKQKQKAERLLRQRLMLTQFLDEFERKYPVEFALAVDSDPEFARNVAQLAEKRKSHQLANHADDNLRASAITKDLSRAKKFFSYATKKNKLGGTKFRKDRNKFAKKLVQRFSDDNLDVVLAILKQKVTLMKKIFSVKTLVEGYGTILQKRQGVKCTKLAIRRLCAVASKLPKKHEPLKMKICTLMIPFLFPLKQSDVKLTKVLVQTKFAQNHVFLKEFIPVITKAEASPSDICKVVYEAMTGMTSEFRSSLWVQESRRSGSVQHAFMALLTGRTEEDVLDVFEEFEKVALNPHSSFPVDSDTIYKQLKFTTKTEQPSLELLFTALLRVELTDKSLIQRIFLYTLLCSERPECKELCADFLNQLLHKCFKRSSSLLEFWMQMILEERRNPDPHKAEYLLIRSLQFLANIFEKLAVTAVNDEKEVVTKPEMKALLPLIQESSSPARNTRRSVKGPIVPIELPVTPRQTRSTQSSDSDGSSKSRKSEEYRKEASDLVELLLTQCVQHNSAHVRHWGLECLKRLLGWQHLEIVWRDLITYVLRFRAAIESDKTQVASAVSRLLSEKSNSKIHDRFVQIGTDDEKLELIRFGFLDLCSGVTVSVFDKLVPYIRPILDVDKSSAVLASYLSTYDGSMKDPSIVRDCLKHKETAKKILSKLSAAAFEKLDMSSKKVLFRTMIDVSASCETAEIRVAVQRTVRKWTLDTEIIEAELEACLLIQRKQVSASNANQRGRKSVSFNLVEDAKLDTSTDWVRRTETVLEFVQSGKRLSRKTKLIQPLFKILKICIEMEEQTPVEYLKQLMLTALTIACEDEEYNDDIQSNMSDWVHFQVDSIIDCLRISRNPQTHHHALILLNYAAKRFPEQVLHGVMSLFTFMGNSILRQDDAYSTQLIQQTVATIIPTLVSSSGARQYSRSLVSAGIYRVFTSAVQDIPVHRRVPIFKSLVEVLEPVESMWQVSFIIVDNALMSENKRNALKSDLELAKNILWQFPPNAVLKTMEKMYIYLAELPLYDKKRNEDFSKCQSAQSAWSKSVVDLSRKHSLKEAQLLINFCLELIAKTVSKFEETDDKSLNFETLLEKCLSFSRLLSALNEEKTFRLIANRNFEVIEKINVALDPKEFVRTVKLILGKDDPGIKKKILDILNQRIMQRFDWFGDATVLAELIPALLSCCAQQVDAHGELVPLVQTAFLSLKLLARHLAMKLPEEFLPVFDMSYTHARNKNPLLAASALLCLSELFCLKSMILPKLNEVTRAVLKAFKVPATVDPAASDIDEDDEKMSGGKAGSMGTYLRVVSGMTTLSKFVEHLGPFVPTSVLSKSLVLILSNRSSLFGDGDKADNRRKVFEQKLKVLTKTIAAKIPLRNSLGSIQKAFSKLGTHPAALVVIVRLLRDSLLATEKADFSAFLPSLFDTFLNDLLVYRDRVVDQEGIAASDVDMVEDSLIEALVSGVVLKLAEGTFRPFYHRVFDWATDSLARKITFFRFSVHAAERLKSLFVTFAGFIIERAAECLTENLDLTRPILQYFYHIFSNDREGFVTIERFNLLVKPLVDLIESDWVISGQIPIRDLNGTIIQLAVAANDLNRWQHLIEVIASKSQHAERKVRLFTIFTLEAIASELEKDFLPLLPPAVPFLADLLGDDDEEVEAETKKMLVKLEAIVGEPLQPYFSA